MRGETAGSQEGRARKAERCKKVITLGLPINYTGLALSKVLTKVVGIGVQVERTDPFLQGSSPGLVLPHTLSLAYLRGAEVGRPWD